MSRLRAFLDASPVSQIALALMRDATGRTEPLAAIAPARPAALRRGRRVGFWSLAAGAGSSTVAALLAHRSAAGGEAPLLVDLDERSNRSPRERDRPKRRDRRIDVAGR